MKAQMCREMKFLLKNPLCFASAVILHFAAVLGSQDSVLSSRQALYKGEGF